MSHVANACCLDVCPIFSYWALIVFSTHCWGVATILQYNRLTLSARTFMTSTTSKISNALRFAKFEGTIATSAQTIPTTFTENDVKRTSTTLSRKPATFQYLRRRDVPRRTRPLPTVLLSNLVIAIGSCVMQESQGKSDTDIGKSSSLPWH